MAARVNSAHLKAERIMKLTTVMQPTDVTPAAVNTTRPPALLVLKRVRATYTTRMPVVATNPPNTQKTRRNHPLSAGTTSMRSSTVEPHVSGVLRQQGSPCRKEEAADQDECHAASRQEPDGHRCHHASSRQGT